MNLKGSAFSDSFRAASSVTGMRLDVTPMKVYEFEDLMADDKNKDYLSQYSIVVVGFRDSYRKAGTPFRTQPAIDALNAYIDAGNSVLFTHDTMAYQASNSDYNELIMTTNLTQPIGMKGPGIFTNSLISKVSSEYTAFNDVSKSGSTKDTTRVNKLNWGQVTEYPYKIDDSIQVETTHGQFYQLNLKHILRMIWMVMKLPVHIIMMLLYGIPLELTAEVMPDTSITAVRMQLTITTSIQRVM